MTPVLSLVVVAHNARAHVVPCLRSISLSSYRDFEVVFVDDASEDDTVETVELFRPTLPSLKVVVQTQRGGPSVARNVGLEHARGEYLAFLDADDWLGRHALGAMVGVLDESGVDFVRVDHVRVEGKWRGIWRAPEWRRYRALSPRDSILPIQQPSMVDYPSPWAGAFRRNLLESGVLRFAPALHTAEDREFIWRLHLDADSYIVAPIIQHFYRRANPDSLTQIGDERQIHYLEAFRMILARVENERPDFFEKAITQFLAIAHFHLEREDRLASDDLRRLHRRRLRGLLRESKALDFPAAREQMGPSRLAMLEDAAVGADPS